MRGVHLEFADVRRVFRTAGVHPLPVLIVNEMRHELARRFDVDQRVFGLACALILRRRNGEHHHHRIDTGDVEEAEWRRIQPRGALRADERDGTRNDRAGDQLGLLRRIECPAVEPVECV